MKPTTTLNNLDRLESLAMDISSWLKEYAENAGVVGFVVGISGGVDSALVSTLCARTGMQTLCLEMPIRQGKSQVSRAKEHIEWLKDKYTNVYSTEIDLTEMYEDLEKKFGDYRKDILPLKLVDRRVTDDKFNFVLGNTRSRLRMITLYQFAGMYDMLVAGTGNKVEDFGIGFFTKGGDGLCDLGPIGSLTKTQVWELSKYLGVSKSIIDAKPTDGLHEDGRTDEDQLECTYPELEWAMGEAEDEKNAILSMIYKKGLDSSYIEEYITKYDGRQKEVLRILFDRHSSNFHKMVPMPIFEQTSA